MTELKRIMHVEDDRSIQAVAKVALEAIGGFQVLSCSGGQEALKNVLDFAPHFILLDVMMPDMDGPQTLERLRELINLEQISGANPGGLHDRQGTAERNCSLSEPRRP